MSFLAPCLAAFALLAAAAVVFLILMPRYFLGVRSGGGIAGFKDRASLVRIGGAACFVATIPLATAAVFVCSSDVSFATVGDQLKGMVGPQLAAPVAVALKFVPRILQSAIYRAKWAFLTAGAIIDLILIASVLVLVFLSRDMDRGPAAKREREHIIELDAEARAELESQEA
jgi:hypothetical protein